MAFGYSPKGTNQNIAFFQIDSPVTWIVTQASTCSYMTPVVSAWLFLCMSSPGFFGPITYFFLNSKWLTEQNKLKSTEMFVCRM